MKRIVLRVWCRRCQRLLEVKPVEAGELGVALVDDLVECVRQALEQHRGHCVAGKAKLYLNKFIGSGVS